MLSLRTMCCLPSGGGDLGFRKRLFGEGSLFPSLVTVRGGGSLLKSLGTEGLGVGVLFCV